MAKRWSKQKAGQQRSKRVRRQRVEEGMGTAGAGTMSGLRGGFRKLLGSSTKTQSPAQKMMDVALWIAVAAAAVYFFGQRCAL